MSQSPIFRRLGRAITAAWRFHERPDSRHELIPHYLDGTLSAEDVAILDEELQRYTRLREDLVQILLNEQQMRELGREWRDLHGIAGP